MIIWSGNHLGSPAVNSDIHGWAHEFLYCSKANVIALKRYKYTFSEVFFMSYLRPFVIRLSWFGTAMFCRNPPGRGLLHQKDSCFISFNIGKETCGKRKVINVHFNYVHKFLHQGALFLLPVHQCFCIISGRCCCVTPAVIPLPPNK